jgi:hypothetical protein
LLYRFLHPPVTPSLFGPNILLTLFSNTLSLCSSLTVRDHVSHPYRTSLLYIFTFIFYLIIFKFLCKAFPIGVSRSSQGAPLRWFPDYGDEDTEWMTVVSGRLLLALASTAIQDLVVFHSVIIL